MFKLFAGKKKGKGLKKEEAEALRNKSVLPNWWKARATKKKKRVLPEEDDDLDADERAEKLAKLTKENLIKEAQAVYSEAALKGLLKPLDVAPTFSTQQLLPPILRSSYRSLLGLMGFRPGPGVKLKGRKGSSRPLAVDCYHSTCARSRWVMRQCALFFSCAGTPNMVLHDAQKLIVSPVPCDCAIGIPAATVRVLKISNEDVMRIQEFWYKIDDKRLGTISVNEFFFALGSADTIFARKVLQQDVFNVAEINDGWLEFHHFLTAVCILCTLSRDQLMHQIFAAYGACPRSVLHVE